MVWLAGLSAIPGAMLGLEFGAHVQFVTFLIDALSVRERANLPERTEQTSRRNQRAELW